MSEHPPAIEEVTALDRVVHEPARLAILLITSRSGGADFTFLLHRTGVTRGSLSKHLRKLEESALVVVHKEFVDRRPKTTYYLTERGRTALEDHWTQLLRLRDTALQ